MRSALKTVRLKEVEDGWVRVFLNQNPWIGNFSDLARISILDFIQRRGEIPLRPITLDREAESVSKRRPSFLWDHDMDESEIRAILESQPLAKKKWLIARILEHASLEDVRVYLTLSDIKEALPKLRMSEKRKRHWELALEVWSRR